MIYGVDDTSTDFLAESTRTLVTKRRFPDATLAVSSLDYLLNIPDVHSDHRFTSSALPTQFHVSLRDSPGGIFAPVEPFMLPSRLDLDVNNR
jgi:hypothetical protein